MISLKRPHNRKWQKRPQLYRGRFFYLKQIFQVTILLSIVVSVFGVVLYFQRSEALFIKHIPVSGVLDHISADDVVRLSQITPNDKLFSIDLKTIIENIKRFSWIDEVRVRREFPDTIQIDVQERQPIALLKLKDFYYIDKNGKVFAKVAAHDSPDLPVLTGLDDDFAKRYPALSKIYLKSALDFLSFLQKQNFYQKNVISEIHFDPVIGYTVFTADNNLEIYYGRDATQKKQEKLEKFSQSKHFNPAQFVRLDLDAKNKVIARYSSL